MPFMSTSVRFNRKYWLPAVLILLLTGVIPALPVATPAQAQSNQSIGQPATQYGILDTYSTYSRSLPEPASFRQCIGTDPGLDDDNDGYSNGDENASGTDPCSSSSLPNDSNRDFIADLHNPDDDNDGQLDLVDGFQLDATNGTNVNLPVYRSFYSNDPGTGFFGLGLTGLMANGTTDYLSLFNPETVTAGGATGRFVIEAASGEMALNTQQNAFQMGLNVDTTTGDFYVESRLDAPFFNGVTPVNGQAQGIYLGTGDQDNYLSVALAPGDQSGGIQVVMEQGGIVTYAAIHQGPDLPDPLAATTIDLRITVDPVASTAFVQYRQEGIEGQWFTVVEGLAIPAAWLTSGDGQGVALGLFATSGASGVPFTATWDYLRAMRAPKADIIVDPQPANGDQNNINNSTYSNASFIITNTSTDGQQITRVKYDMSSAFLPDLAFDPNGTAGDDVSKPLTPNSSTSLVGYQSGQTTYGGAFDAGFATLTANFNDFDQGESFSFSIDIDPTSIQGTSQPGPSESGSVSGLEMVGTIVTITYDDGSQVSHTLFRRGTTQDGSEIVVQTGLPATPTISVVGIANPPVTVTSASQTVRVSGPAGAAVKLLVVDAALYIEANPETPISTFEANSAVKITQYSGTIGGGGTVDINVTLTRTNNNAGLNHLIAVVTSGGKTSKTSNTIVLKYNPGGATSTPTKTATKTLTKTPTSTSTKTPTSIPTNTATSTSTKTPTSIPTNTPTSEPTAASTAAATDIPTDIPTHIPTSPPTETATGPATELPTTAGTEPATDIPTSFPTDAVTEAPTDASTDSPTDPATVSPTDAPTVTATASATQTQGIELLLNGGFELDINADTVPDKWKASQLTKDERRCNDPSREIAFEGVCTFQFKGGGDGINPEAANLTQVIATEGLDFTGGGELTASAYLKAKKATTAGAIKVVAIFNDSSKEKFTVPFIQTTGSDYELIAKTRTFSGGDLVKLKVQIRHRSAGGKVLLDTVSLIWAASTTELIPLPLP